MAKNSKETFGDSPCIAAAIRKASRRLAQLYDDALGPAGLRTTQYSILFELDRPGEEASDRARTRRGARAGSIGIRPQSAPPSADY
jgi:hypothetical protein